MRKIRILVSDPYATDSSSDEEQIKRPPRGKHLAHEIFIDKVEEAVATLKQTSIHNDTDCELDHHHIGGVRSPIKKYAGAHRRSSGRFSAEIKDPIKNKRVWLGTFDTAEEAHRVYITRKMEIQKEIASRREGLEWVVCRESNPMPDIDGSNSCHKDRGTKMVEEEDAPMQNNGGLEMVVHKGSKPVPDIDGSRLCCRGHETANSNDGKIGEENVPMQKCEGAQWVVRKRSKRILYSEASNLCKGGRYKRYPNERKNTGGSKTEQILSKSNDHSLQRSPHVMEVIDPSHGGSQPRINDSMQETSALREISKRTGLNSGELMMFDAAEENVDSALSITKDDLESKADSALREDGVGIHIDISGMEENFRIENGQEGNSVLKLFGTYKSPSSMLEIKSEAREFGAEIVQCRDGHVKGMFVQDSNGQEVNFKMKYALPVIDNNGFLLGQWSWIDDLSIS